MHSAFFPVGPRFIQVEKMKKKDIERPVGSSVRLRCRAEGNPPPKVAWLKNKDVMQSDDTNEKRPTWTLKLTELTGQDSGLYTCVVSNERGQINYTYSLDVIGTCFHCELKFMKMNTYDSDK